MTMIPAPRGWLFARYEHELNGKSHHTYKPIIGWDEDGGPMIVREDHRVAPAGTYGNYDGIANTDEYDLNEVIAIMPADGWRISYEDGSSEPLVGWALRRDGSVLPLSTDETGYADTFEISSASDGVRIYHPNCTPAPAAAPPPAPGKRLDVGERREDRGHDPAQ